MREMNRHGGSCFLTDTASVSASAKQQGRLTVADEFFYQSELRYLCAQVSLWMGAGVAHMRLEFRRALLQWPVPRRQLPSINHVVGIVIERLQAIPYGSGYFTVA